MRTMFYYDSETGMWGRVNRDREGREPLLKLEDIPEKYRNVLMLVMTANFLGNEKISFEYRREFSEALSTPELRVQAYNNLEEVHFTEQKESEAI